MTAREDDKTASLRTVQVANRQATRTLLHGLEGETPRYQVAGRVRRVHRRLTQSNDEYVSIRLDHDPYVYTDFDGDPDAWEEWEGKRVIISYVHALSQAKGSTHYRVVGADLVDGR